MPFWLRIKFTNQHQILMKYHNLPSAIIVIIITIIIIIITIIIIRHLYSALSSRSSKALYNKKGRVLKRETHT